MSDGAIDFRKLLKEEKKKARQKQRQQLSQPTATAAATATGDDPSHHQEETKESAVINIDASAKNYVVREEDVEAIDYEQLRQAEKERAARRQRETVMAESWSIPTTALNRTQNLLCRNPPNIYYIADFMPQPEDQQSLLEWLQSLPENSNKNHKNNNDTCEIRNANGAWTEMTYAKRRVALFDATSTANYDETNRTHFEHLSSSSPPSAFASYPALQWMADALVSQGIFSKTQPPNHILVNEYHPGQGIMAHTDGPAYASRTATLSLGSDVLISFTPRPNFFDGNTASDSSNLHADRSTNRSKTGDDGVENDKDTTANGDQGNIINTSNSSSSNTPKERICLLQKGSLLVFEDSAYLDYCHEIIDRILVEHVTDQCLNAGPEHIGTTIFRGYRISLTFRHKYHTAPSSSSK